MLFRLKSELKKNYNLHCIFLFVRNKLNFQNIINKNTEIVIAGFPRCANTFLRNILIYKVPNINIASHMHSIGELKKAHSKKLPTIVLIRHPVEAISSLSIRNSKSKITDINDLIMSYMVYYKYVIKVIPDGLFHLVDFNQLTKKTESVVDDILGYFNMQELSVNSTDIDYVKMVMRIRDNRDERKRNLSNSVKQDEKKEIKKIIKMSPLHSELMALYDSICNMESL